MDNQVIFAIITATGWALAYVGIKKSWKYRALMADISRDAEKTERKLAKANAKAVEAEIDAKKAAEDLARVRDALIDARSAAESAAEACAKAEKLAQERFDLIEGVIEEKQVVWRLYRDSTKQAAVAQNWLMREYSAALKTLNSYRAKSGESEAKPPPALAGLVAEFGDVAAKLPDAPPVQPGVAKESAGPNMG